MFCEFASCHKIVVKSENCLKTVARSSFVCEFGPRSTWHWWHWEGHWVKGQGPPAMNIEIIILVTQKKPARDKLISKLMKLCYSAQGDHYPCCTKFLEFCSPPLAISGSVYTHQIQSMTDIHWHNSETINPSSHCRQFSLIAWYFLDPLW